MQQYKSTKQVDSARLSTGKSPAQSPLDEARKDLLHYINHRQFGELLNYTGYPGNITSEATNINGNFDNNFYIIFPVVKPAAGDKIRIGVEATSWDYTAVGTASPTWDGVASGDATDFTTSLSTAQRDDVTSLPAGQTLRDSSLIDYDNNQLGNYGYTLLNYVNLCPASVTAFTMPLTLSEYQGLDPYGTSFPQFYAGEDSFNMGQIMRGADVADGTMGSIGELCQRQGSVDDGEANVMDSSAYCLFQYGHPSGKYCSYAASSTVTEIDVFGCPIQVAPRGVKGSTNPTLSKVDIVAIVRGNTGATLRVTADGTADSVYYQLTYDITSPTMILLGDVDVDPTGDTLTVLAGCSDTQALDIKTFAVFEKHNGI